MKLLARRPMSRDNRLMSLLPAKPLPPFPRVLQGTGALSLLNKADAYRLLDELFDAGCRAFDTAHAYGKGQAETLLGDWLAKRHRSADVIILGKGCVQESMVSPSVIARELDE